MARQKKFNFIPMTPAVVGRKKDEFKPFVKIGKMGTVNMAKGSLDKLGLNRLMFYRLFQDKGRRTVGIFFTEKESITTQEAEANWKVWEPKMYKSITVMSFSVKGLIDQLDEVVLPTQRLPVEKYLDTETNSEFLWFRIPYGDETPGGKKMFGQN